MENVPNLGEAEVVVARKQAPIQKLVTASMDPTSPSTAACSGSSRSAVIIWTTLGDPDPVTGQVRGPIPGFMSARQRTKCVNASGSRYVLDGVEVPLGQKVNHTKCPFEALTAGGTLNLGADGTFQGVEKDPLLICACATLPPYLK